MVSYCMYKSEWLGGRRHLRCFGVYNKACKKTTSTQGQSCLSRFTYKNCRIAKNESKNGTDVRKGSMHTPASPFAYTVNRVRGVGASSRPPPYEVWERAVARPPMKCGSEQSSTLLYRGQIAFLPDTGMSKRTSAKSERSPFRNPTPNGSGNNPVAHRITGAGTIPYPLS